MRIQTIFLLLVSYSVHAQAKVFGDTEIIKKIEAATATIYHLKDTTYFFLTEAKFFHRATTGTNIVAYEFKRNINRIVAFTILPDGLLSAEYYYRNDTVLMIYKSLEYYKETSPPHQEKNFKGLAFWESRFYFANGKLAAHKHSNSRNVSENYTGAIESKEAATLFKYVNSQLTKTTDNNR